MKSPLDLHLVLKGKFPTLTGITRPIDTSLPTQLCWETPPDEKTLAQAQAIADAWDWSDAPEKPKPTTADVESKLDKINPAAKQSLIDQMLKEYLVERPDILETL